MILNRNYKYKKGFFHATNNYTPKKILAFGVSVSIFIGTLINLGLNINHFSVEHPVQTDNYFIKNAVVTQVYDEYYGQQEISDHQVTIEELEKVKQLTITPNDLYILPYCKSLEELEITDCDFITDDMFLNINQLSNLKEITFELKSAELFLENPEYKIDLDKLKSDANINISFSSTEEFIDDTAYFLLSILKDSELTHSKIENNKIFFQQQEKTSLKNYIDLDNKLNEMITNCHFTEKTTEKEKIRALIQIVTDFVEYDPIIKSNIYAIKLHQAEKHVNELSHFYNYHPISSTFTKNGNGICVNYSSLFTILAYKCGMESYNVEVENEQHMINLVKIDGIYRLIDLTNIDNDSMIKYIASYLLTSNKQGHLDFVIDYSMSSNINSIDSGYKIKIANNYIEHDMKEQIEEYQLYSYITKENAKTRSEEVLTNDGNQNKILIKYDGTSFASLLPFELIMGISFSAYLMKILEKEIIINTAYLTKCKGLKANKQLKIIPTNLPVGCATITQEKKENGQTKDILFISKQDTLERFFSSKNKKRCLQEKKTTWHPNLINATLQDYHTFLFPCDSLEDIVTFIKQNKKAMNKADHIIIIEENEKYSFETIQEVFQTEDIPDRLFYKQKTSDKIIPILEKEKVNCKRMKRKYC